MKFILFFFFILFFTNCSASKQTCISRQQTDSIHQISRLSIRTTKIPESRANLAVPVGTLKELPAGATFVQKNGQATAEIHFQHDTLFVYATCDSLQNLVYQYETIIEQRSNQTTQQEKNKKQNYRYENLLIGLLLICILLYLFRKR